MQEKQDLTIEELLPNSELNDDKMAEIYSDHLPKLTVVPINEDQSIHVLSYNTLSEWLFQGFDQRRETDEQKESRHQRISTFIKNLATQSNLDLISLQETTKELAQQIKDRLGDDWKLASTDGNRVILYNTSQFSLTKVIMPGKIDRGTGVFNTDFLGALLTQIIQ